MNEHYEKSCAKCFSFKGVIVGALVAFGLIFLFTFFTMGVGLSAYTKTEKGLEILVFFTYLWLVAGSFMMLFFAGLATSWVAHYSETASHRRSIIHGFVTWVIYVIISLAFLSNGTEASILTFPKNFVSVAAETQATTQAIDSESITTMQNDKNKTLTNPATQQEAHKIGLATLAAFFVFFVEVVGCCFGAWCGTEFKSKYCK